LSVFLSSQLRLSPTVVDNYFVFISLLHFTHPTNPSSVVHWAGLLQTQTNCSLRPTLNKRNCSFSSSISKLVFINSVVGAFSLCIKLCGCPSSTISIILSFIISFYLYATAVILDHWQIFGLNIFGIKN